MGSGWEVWLKGMAFAAIIFSFLLYNLWRRRDLLARVTLCFFFLCLAFIHLNWLLGLDLAQYDARLYQALGAAVSEKLRTDLLDNLPAIFLPYAAYTVPLGLLYCIFGVSPLVGQLFNTLMGIGVTLNLHRLALLCFNRRVADLTALLAALYPYGWVLSGTLNRDMTIAFLLTLFFRILAELPGVSSSSDRRLKITVAFGCVLYLTLLRPPLLLLSGVTLVAYLRYRPKVADAKERLFRPVKTALVVILLALLGAGLQYQGDYLQKFRLAGQAAQFTDIDNLNERLKSSEDAGSAYKEKVRYKSYLDILRVLPRAVFYFMFSPLPWQVNSLKQSLGLLDSACLILIFYYFLKGIKDLYVVNKRFALALLAFLVVGFTTSSLLQANVGAAMRHRSMFYFLMFPVAVHGFLRCRDRCYRLSCGIAGSRPGPPSLMPSLSPPLSGRPAAARPGPYSLRNLGLLALLGAAASAGALPCKALAFDPAQQYPVVSLQAAEAQQGAPFTLELAGARNEYLLALFRLDGVAAAKVQAQLAAGDPGSRRLPKAAFYQVCWAVPHSRERFQPDALLPLGQQSASPSEPPVILTTLKVPPDLPRGRYRYDLVFSDGSRTYRQPLLLRVFDFTLPDDLPLTIYGGFWNYRPDRYRRYGVNSQERYLELVKSYYHCLREYKINALGGPYFFPFDRLTPGVRVEDFQEYHGLLSYALNNLRYRFFQIPNPPGWRTVGRPESPFRSRAELFYPLFEAYLKRQGWQHRGLNYLIDEPQPNLYPAVEQAFGLAKGLAPTIKTLCAGWDPAPGFAKVIDLWATPASRLRESEIAAARAKGQEQWLYANRLHGLDHPPVHQRLIGWLLHRYQFPGYLAWGMNYWPKDPWTSVPGPDDFWRRGTFLYPHPQNGLPVPTLRLVSFRRGLQDYQYLAMFKEAGDRGRVPASVYVALDQKIQTLTADLKRSAFPVAMQDLENIRLHIGELLDGQGKTGL